MTVKPFIFLGDLIELKSVEQDITEVELMQGVLLKKASKEQVTRIKSVLHGTKINMFLSRFEHKVIERTETSYTAERVEESEWNYWIIELDDNQQRIDLDFLLLFTTKKFHVILYQHVQDGQYFGYSLPNLKTFNYIEKLALDMKQVTMTDQDIEELSYINHYYAEYNTQKGKYQYIDKGIMDFRNIDQISESSPFYFLNLFSIIECILITNRNNSRSITYQLKSKFNLLNNRFSNSIDINNYFPGYSFEIVIEKLYMYRSDIAHGDFSDFNNELQLILNKDAATEFLFLLVKNLVKQSLIEPQLISDLKNC